MRNAILAARINGTLLMTFGIFCGFASLVDSDETIKRRIVLALICTIAVVSGGAASWWGFRKSLPPSNA